MKDIRDGPSYEKSGARPLTDAEVADREERKILRAHGRKGELSATYRARMGSPPVCRPGDHEAARAYLDRILSAIDDGGWTPSEWGRLYRLKRKWQDRAEGKSPRFEAMGTKVGGMNGSQRKVWADNKVSACAHSILGELDKHER